MIDNNVQRLRKERGLTQAELAKKIGTSQQQIQRIEAGVQTAKLEFAIALSSALDAPLNKLFPKLKAKAVERAQQKPAEERIKAFEAAFRGSGIETDPAHWTLRVILTNGELYLFHVPANDRERIEANLRDADPFDAFFVFDDKGHRNAIRKRAVAFSQMCFDVFVDETREKNAELLGPVQFFFRESKEPFLLEVDADENTGSEEDDYEGSQLNSMFFYLDSDTDGTILQLTDQDGEVAVIPTTHITMVRVPLGLVEPELEKAVFDGMEEDGEI